MLHKHLEAHVVGKDGSARRGSAVGTAGHVGSGRVELGKEETRLAAVLVADNVAGDGETVHKQVLRVRLGRLEDLLKVFVALLVLVARLAPLGDGLTVEDEQVEEGVEQEHHVGADGHGVKQHGLRRALEPVGHERGLDHDQRAVHVLAVEHVAVVGGLVGRVVEHLEELAAAQVEHELGVDIERLAEPEARRVVLAVVGKLLAEPDEHAVEPAEHVGAVVDLGLEDGDAGHEHRGGLLVEGEWDLAGAGLGKVARHRGHPQAVLAGGVLVVRYELDQAAAAGRERLPGGGDHLKVHRGAGARGDGAEAPGGRVPDADLGLAHARRLLVGRDGVADEPAHLELLGALHVERGIEAHLQVALLVLVKDLVEALLEDAHLEAVHQQLVPVGQVAQRVHLEQADLVQAARVHVDRVPVVRRAPRDGLVVPARAPEEAHIVLLNVVVRPDALPQLGGDHLAGPLGGRPATEEHDPRARVLVRGLQQAHRHAERRAGAPLRTLVARHGPRVPLQLLEDPGELVLALRHGQQEARDAQLRGARGARRARPAGRARCGARAGREPEHVLDVLGRVVLTAAEHVALRAVLVPELVHLDHGAERDEAHERVRRQQAQAYHERLAERLEVVRVHARVHHVEEDGRDLSGPAQRVLDRGVLGQQLRRQVRVADVLVVRGERVAREAEGADPQLAAHVDLAVGVSVCGRVRGARRSPARRTTYQYGFSTARHGGLHVTGS